MRWGLITDQLNAETMDNLLPNLSKRSGEMPHAVLDWDIAQYHTSKKLAIPANITRLPLPVYPPKTNCVKRV